jgi:A/G-specific adenine glycosylase
MTIFSDSLLTWYDIHGRKDLPWQDQRDPYRIWISEMMLQQTQVKTVIPYFQRFIKHFPNVAVLAQASEDEVLSLWSGLGYYARARNLHRTAQLISANYQNSFPKTLTEWIAFPGIGPSTAAAILSQAFNQPHAILDGNVKRVLTRFFAISGYPGKADVNQLLFGLAQFCMPKKRCGDYTQAIMDLGATICRDKNPVCANCPLQTHCLAFKRQEQTLYPTKKIKKPTPLRHQQFLVLHHKERVYLEKRPTTGLWGGLWCLPSLEIDQCPVEFIRQHHGFDGDVAIDLMSHKHRFTHFHLQIMVRTIHVRTALQNKWVNIDNELRLELPSSAPCLRRGRLFGAPSPHVWGEGKGSSLKGSAEGQWFAQKELSSLGLAKPTSVILAVFYKH